MVNEVWLYINTYYFLFNYLGHKLPVHQIFKNQPCVVQTLSPISVGQTGAISVPHVKSDPDPERWSKTCNKLEYFSPPQCSRPIPPNNPSEDYINSLHIVRLHMCISHKSWFKNIFNRSIVKHSLPQMILIHCNQILNLKRKKVCQLPQLLMTKVVMRGL